MQKIEANGINFAVSVDGPADGPVVTLSNSLATDHRMWDGQMPALTDRYRVVRYDRRGHGQSDAPAGPYSIEMLVEDARQILAALGIARTHWCGLSLGGMVGQRIATLHPELIDKLVLCDTSARMAPPSLWDERIAMVAEDGMKVVVDATLQRWFTPGLRERDPATLARVSGMIEATPVAGYQGCCAAIRDMDQTETIRAIKAPTLVIVGADDPSTPVDHARILEERIPGARLEVVPDAAHLANVEQPAIFNRLLRDFLDS